MSVEPRHKNLMLAPSGLQARRGETTLLQGWLGLLQLHLGIRCHIKSGHGGDLSLKAMTCNTRSEAAAVHDISQLECMLDHGSHELLVSGISTGNEAFCEAARPAAKQMGRPKRYQHSPQVR